MNNIISEKETILLVPILEKKRTMGEIFAIFEGGKRRKKIVECFRCRCGKVYKRWEIGKRRVCHNCKIPFYPSYYFRKIRKPLTEEENRLTKEIKLNFEKMGEKVETFEIDWNKFYSWSSNNKKYFKKLEGNGLLKKTKAGKSYRYDLNFELLSESYLNYLQTFTPILEKEIDLRKFKNHLNDFLIENRNIFSYEVWNFLFEKNKKGEFPFNSIFGFMNFIFLSIPVTKIIKIYDTKPDKTENEVMEFINILSVWQIISDTVEEMYAKVPIWELEWGIEKNGVIVGVLEGYHLVTDETKRIWDTEISDEFIKFLKKIYSHVFTEVEEKTDSGLDYFFKKGFKVKLNNEFLPIKEYCKITFDRKIRKMLVS